MKKIFALILMLLFCNVNAKTYYSDYGEISDYTDKEIISNDVTSVEKTKFYQAYKENIITTYNEEDNNGNYILETKDWVDYKPQYYESEKKVYEYLSQRQIIIENNAYDDDIMVTNFVIKSKEPIHYGMYVYKLKEIHGNLGDVKLEDITISLRTTEGKSNKNINIYITNGKEKKLLKSINIYDKELHEYNNFSSLDDLKPVITTTDDFEKIKYIQNNIISEKTYYLKQIKLFKHDDIIKKYYDIYLNEENEDYKLDYDKLKYMYRFKSRDKVEIEDNIKITSYDQNLDDFIKSDKKIKYTTNMNKLVNGLYVVNYITPFKTIKKDVIVDINENYHILLREQQLKLETMYKSYLESNYLVDKKNNEIKEIIENSNDSYILKEYESCKTKLREKEIEKLDLNEKKTNSKNMSSIILIIILTIIMSISVLFKKNVD